MKIAGALFAPREDNKDENKVTRLLSSAKTKRDRLVEFKYKHKQIEA